MKKILPILIALTMVCSALPALALFDSDNQAYNPYPYQYNIITHATIKDGNGGTGTVVDPGNTIIKVKWEYDEDVDLTQNTYDTDPTHHFRCPLHDAAPCIDHLQVAPQLGSAVNVGYYAIISDRTGMSPDPTSKGYHTAYVDVWHPDGQYKYQVKMEVVGWDYNSDTGLMEYNEDAALAAWAHVCQYHSDLVRVNRPWADTLVPADVYGDIVEELDQQDAFLYYATRTLDYCQPGGHYYVGVTAFDNAGAQAAYLYNSFWYIPTSAVELDFKTVEYNPVQVGVEHTAMGDTIMDTETYDSASPTVRNIGNSPVYLAIEQDDTDFGWTQPNNDPNVQYQARMGGDGDWSEWYYPILPDASSNPTRIPGTLPLCTYDKLDFKILVDKATQGLVYSGWMKIYAYVDHTGFEGTGLWVEDFEDFVGNAPAGLPQNWFDLGITDPWTP